MTTAQSPGPQPPDSFVIEEATIAEIQTAMQAQHLTSRHLVDAYLARIEAIDRDGPTLRSIIELNPDAARIADALDAERKLRGPRGPMHGIPVLIKDNISTADAMHTTAGSLALAGHPALYDAHIVERLRAAGAVILGKTNLSEWANLRSKRATSGWSARGGLTLNPYALDRNTSGSSSGSGAATSANLTTVAVGTETDGSIVSPASIHGLVGIKPTVGLVSRYGIIPIAKSQDTAGPMARSVADAAILLTALAGGDARDPVTNAAPSEDYTRHLDADGLRGARLGVVRALFGDNERINDTIDAAIGVLRSRGAQIIDPVVLANADKYGDAELTVLLYEMKDGLNRYFREFAPHAPVQSIAELIRWNDAHAALELRYFGQEYLIEMEQKGDLTQQEYLDALATCARYARTEGLDALFAKERLDAVIAPTGSTAWVTDFVNGDHSGASFSSPAAVAGYPHITVPAGMVSGLPVGLSFVGPAFSEGRLIRYAYSFEQATHARRRPRYAADTALEA
jgi:amidase